MTRYSSNHHHDTDDDDDNDILEEYDEFYDATTTTCVVDENNDDGIHNSNNNHSAIVEYTHNNDYQQENDDISIDEDNDEGLITTDNRSPSYMKIYDANGEAMLVPIPSSSSFLTSNHNHNKKKRTRWWLYLSISVILFQILFYYGPPSPPQSEQYQTWYQFGLTKSREIIMPILDISLVIPIVTRWCWKGIQYDVREHLLLWKKEKRNKCILKQDWNNDDFWKEDTTADNNNNSFLPIIQPRAKKVISQTIQAWKPEEKALVMALSGTIGVGKKYVVNKLSKSLICSNEELLEIDGKEYATTRLLLPRLREHIFRRNHQYGNTVIVINHAEDMATGVLFEILDELSKTPRLVILITTHVGSKTIHQRILQQQQELNSFPPSMDWDIRDELDSKLGLGVSNYVTAVAPFVPLGPIELETILMQKVHNLSSSLKVIHQMTPKLTKIWTSPKYIEYYEPKKRSNNSIMMFSSRGASLLETNQLSQLQSELLACFLPSSSSNKLLSYDLIEIDYDNNDNDNNAAVIRACQKENDGDSDDEHYLLCDHICRFAL